MSLGAVGAFLLVLIVVFVIGNLWFHFVESLLERIKHLLTSRSTACLASPSAG
ncbi:MAG: hypothetical protein V8R40_00760 [Dysosmobacter sp.]